MGSEFVKGLGSAFGWEQEVKGLLQGWLQSYQAKYKRNPMYSNALESCKVLPCRFAPDRMISVLVESKAARDELVKCLKLSPMRRDLVPTVGVKASLTVMQCQNHAAITRAFEGRQGIKFAMAADRLELWREGPSAKFTFSLALSPA